MRTTLTVDDDLVGLLKERSRKRGVAFKTIVNEVLRIGLGAEAKATASSMRVTPHSFGFRPGVDQDKLGQLADDLESEAFAESWQQQVERT